MRYRTRRHLRLTDAEILLLILSGECYEDSFQFGKRYGYDPKQWPDRGFVIKAANKKTKWVTWDKRHGWLQW